jgi:hypothetical protein
MVNAMETLPDLQERYRRPSPVQRGVALVIVASLVASGVGLLAWTVLFQSTPAVTSQLTAFSVADEHEAVANITVGRESQFTDATCRIRAIAEDHTVVGDLSVLVTDGPAKQSLQVRIRTERKATSVELLGCTAPGQPRPR